MVKKIEHLGIAVKEIDEAVNVFETLFQAPCYKTETVDSEGVRTAFIQVGDAKIELLEATHPESPIAKFLATRNQGFHHVAFEVDNIEEEIERLSGENFELIHLQPKDGADNKRIAFLHPKSTLGLLVELCQEKTTSSSSNSSK
jgi:methylmalonyl-CoA/ethylmalonyl-CoA epimerase